MRPTTIPPPAAKPADCRAWALATFGTAADAAWHAAEHREAAYQRQVAAHYGR